MFFIVQYHQRGIVITHRKKKLEIMDDNSYKLYNFDVSAVYYETDVPYVSFVRHFNERVPSTSVLSNTHSFLRCVIPVVLVQ